MLQTVIRIVVAAILISAIVSKINTAPAILRGESLLASPQLLYATIGVESAVAAWALFAPALWAWRVITSLFISLTVVATWTTWVHVECNCFGNYLPTGASIPIDIGVVTAMLLSRSSWKAAISVFDDVPADLPRASKVTRNLSDSWSMTSLIGACLVSVIAATVSSVALHRVVSRQETQPSLKFLLADDWVGQAWPLTENFHRELSQLSKGKWLALVLRSDCNHCNELVTRIAAGRVDGNDLKLVSFVSGGRSWPIHLGKASTDQLSPATITWSSEEPVLASPAAFLIEDGIVIDAQDGGKAEKFVVDTIASGAIRKDLNVP